MKTILFLIFIFNYTLAACQEFKIPNVEYQSHYQDINPYVELLRLENKNALIIKLSYPGHWYKKGKVTRFITYNENGKIAAYKKLVFNVNNKTKIRKRMIRPSEKIHFYRCLEKVISKNMLNINGRRLNIKKKQITKDEGISISVYDGIAYSFEITQGSGYSKFSSYSPETYIEKKFPGFEDRIKLLSLMNEFEVLFKRIKM